MNNLIRHGILLLLALTIALGSVGIALGQQLCQMVMVQSASTEIKGCCSESETSGTEDDCCKLEVTYKKLDLISTAKADFLNKLYVIVPPIVPQPLYNLPAPTIAAQVLSYSDSSPPLSGRTILLLKRSLQV
ncbi:hypothetical protein [Pontibacter burrus]|uniref:Uncharacterized protein n=1 Tax=Pontibacter burrus TaxID=2704466 RepID=A0A6B3LN75_9BACT|nr:hypothetical protein [Pontibacter burrus]NEM97343.1 hypothetical protein [Pontibacter burrus]